MFNIGSAGWHVFTYNTHEKTGPFRRSWSTHLPDVGPTPSQLKYLMGLNVDSAGWRMFTYSIYETTGPPRRSWSTHLPNAEPAHSQLKYIMSTQLVSACFREVATGPIQGVLVHPSARYEPAPLDAASTW